MELNNLFSLLSVIVMAFALWCSRLYLESNIVYVLQIIGYALLAASSWFAGIHSAVLVFVMCAVTLLLKIIGKYPYRAIPFLVLGTLVGGLLVNNSGWVGVLPVAAGTGVVFRHAYYYSNYLPSKMDNANRRSGHALDIFLENVIEVAMWGVYALLIGDRFMLYWRGFSLVLNLVNYVKRCKGIINTCLDKVIPHTNSKGRPIQRKKIDWVI